MALPAVPKVFGPNGYTLAAEALARDTGAPTQETPERPPKRHRSAHPRDTGAPTQETPERPPSGRPERGGPWGPETASRVFVVHAPGPFHATRSRPEAGDDTRTFTR